VTVVDICRAATPGGIIAGTLRRANSGGSPVCERIAAFAVAAPVAANAIVTAAAASFVAILLGQRIFESIIVSRPWSSRTLLEVWMKFTRLSF
jgi:hypothetical protein